MGSVVRSIGAVIAGFIVASLVMMLVEGINGHLIYPELGKAAAGVTDRDAIRAIMLAAPLGAFLVVMLGWILGGLAGGFTAEKISARAGGAPALVLGVLLTLAGIANNLMLPPPLWFWIASMLVLLPATLAGARMARQ